jgi:hypothetical protein
LVANLNGKHSKLSHTVDSHLISGFYFPNTEATFKYYNGTILEEEYEKKLMVRQPSSYVP